MHLQRSLRRGLTTLAALALTLTFMPHPQAAHAGGGNVSSVTTDTLTSIDTATKQPGLTEVVNVARGEESLRKSMTWDIEDLNAKAVETYNQYIKRESDGTFRAEIPAEFYFTDPKGAWAATNAVITANTTVVAQLEALQAKGYKVRLNQYVYGQALPMGEHATFTPLWWGMTFTFDPVATRQIDMALTMTDGALTVVQALSGVGVIMAPPVGAIVGAVSLALKMSIAMTKKCMGPNGLIIKSLWLPIPWCEKPSKKFVSALRYDTFSHGSPQAASYVRGDADPEAVSFRSANAFNRGLWNGLWAPSWSMS